MLTLKTVTFFAAHVFLKRLCLPIPSLSIDCRSLLPLINFNTNKNSEISTIVNDIPLYSYNFYRLLYDIVVCDVFFIMIQTQACTFLDALFTQGPALARQENIYSGTVNTDNHAMMCVLSECPYYLRIHIKLALWKKVTDVIYLLHGIKKQGGRRVGTMTVAKSQGRETC